MPYHTMIPTIYMKVDQNLALLTGRSVSILLSTVSYYITKAILTISWSTQEHFDCIDVCLQLFSIR